MQAIVAEEEKAFSSLLERGVKYFSDLVGDLKAQVLVAREPYYVPTKTTPCLVTVSTTQLTSPSLLNACRARRWCRGRRRFTSMTRWASPWT